jgi:hypothetical protein
VHSHLDRVAEVASSWNLSLNGTKCVVMRLHRGYIDWNILDDIDTEYSLGGERLWSVNSHRYLGVWIDNSLKFHQHVRITVPKASYLASGLFRSTIYHSADFMVSLFISRIRPILDYGCCIWNVGYLGDLHLLESVERRWTSQVDGLGRLDYVARLRVFGLFSISGRL